MDGGSWFIERACHIGLDIQCSRGPLSPSVRRTKVLPVPVCPTVLPKQKCTRCKTPSDREVGMRSLARFYAGSCTVSWSTRSCFYPWYFTREPSNAIQLSGTVDEGVASHASVSEPDVRLSPHPGSSPREPLS